MHECASRLIPNKVSRGQNKDAGWLNLDMREQPPSKEGGDVNV